MSKKQAPPLKPRDKIIETTNIHGEPAYTNIKIICVNIAEKLESRIEQIKKFIKEENPDLLCLQETHMFNENFKTIQRWFKNNKYDLINCSISQKNKYEEVKKQKIEEIRSNENITNYRKEILIG
jgi:exonuclease III